MPQVGEYKSNVGVRDLYYALVTQDDLSAYAADTPALLAPLMTVNVSPASNTKTQYADDGPFDTMSSEGETKIELELTQIPMEIRAIILGKVFDTATGRLFDNGGTPPDIALSFRSLKSNGKYHYVQYLKGKFTPPSKELSTKTDSPDPKATKITFTAIKTIHPFVLSGSVTDGSKGVEGDEDIANFSPTGFFSAVQIPVYGTPSALTCTPSPADGASAQSTSVAITLTFNNPLASGAENGIGLLRSDTMAAIAVTRSVNAARTVVTLTHSALTAAKTYLLTVNGARDVYGQSLVDTVYDFATA
jgi:phi13 family phage major tail protein